MRNRTALRTLICALLAALAALALATTAGASPRQMSLMQDDAEMFGAHGENPDAAMAEMKALGVDVLRTNVLFYRVYREIGDRVKPAGFDTSNPHEPLYSWGEIDRVVNLAERHGVKLLFTVSGPGPYWASQNPRKCRNDKICTWKPKVNEFGQFAEAVAKRYAGRVEWYSIYNEPNLKEWITPQVKRSRFGPIWSSAITYRKLWKAGYKAIRKHDPRARKRVLFGEMAAIGGPLPKIYASLCLDEDGKPFRGRLRKLHRCGGKFRRLPIGGWAIHPYNQGGFGSPFRKTRSKTALPQQYLPRLHRLSKIAARRGRVPRNRGVYITEFGYQTNPPDRISRITPRRQAQYINESDRLFFGDRRVKTVAQYQLVDVRDPRQYNSGLRFAGPGAKKPSYDAYRLPLVVTKRPGRKVEVYGQVRPASLARKAGEFTRPQVQVRKRGRWRTVARPRPNPVGIFRFNKRIAGAAKIRWRMIWDDPVSGEMQRSRIAKAGRALRYYRN